MSDPDLHSSSARPGNGTVLLAAAALSLLLSLLVFQRDALINSDGILYLRSALFLSEGLWSEAIASYRWPLYSALIALVHSLAGLSLESAALVVNALLDALTVCTFILLLKELGADRRCLWWGAAIILSLPFFNDSRAELIRGHGFWPFFLLALLLFLRFRQRPDIRRAVAWFSACGVATLFRVEGFLLPLVMPLLLLAPTAAAPLAERVKWMGRLYAPLLVTVALLMVPLVVWPEVTQELLHSSRILDPLTVAADFWKSLSQNLPAKVDLVAQTILPTHSQEFASAGVALLLGWIFVVHIINGLSPIYALLLPVALRAGGLPPFSREAHQALAGLIALNLVVLGVDLIARLYLSIRFTIPLALVLLLYLPFMLARLELRAPKWRPWLAAAILVATADGLITHADHQRRFVLEASAWLHRNAGPTALVVTNFDQMEYYTNRSRSPEAWIRFHSLRPELGMIALPERFTHLAIYRRGDAPANGFAPLLDQAEPVGAFDAGGRDRVELYRARALPVSGGQ